jgi:hypothetical protein
MNEAVRSGIEEHALSAEAVEQVIQLTERDDVVEQRARLEREGKDVAKRIERLVAAVASATTATSVWRRCCAGPRGPSARDPRPDHLDPARRRAGV